MTGPLELTAFENKREKTSLCYKFLLIILKFIIRALSIDFYRENILAVPNILFSASVFLWLTKKPLQKEEAFKMCTVN